MMQHQAAMHGSSQQGPQHSHPNQEPFPGKGILVEITIKSSGCVAERSEQFLYMCCVDIHCSLYTCMTLRSVSLPQHLVQVYLISHLRNHLMNPLDTL